MQDDRPTLKRPDSPRRPDSQPSERTIPERPSHRAAQPGFDRLVAEDAKPTQLHERPKPLPSILKRAPTQRPEVVATDVASGVIVAVSPRERRPDSRATTERRPERFARGTSPPPDPGDVDAHARGISPVLDALTRDTAPGDLARGTAPNDALDTDSHDDAIPTGVHPSQSDDEDPLVEVLNALSPPGESLDTDPFERVQAPGPVTSGPQMPTMMVYPPPGAQRRSTPSVENHVVGPAWAEHASSTEQLLLHYRPTDQMWLGSVVSPPAVGAPLVIGRFMQPDFTITSPVTQIITRQDGMLVQTTTKNRYFVDNVGATYLVRRVG